MSKLKIELIKVLDKEPRVQYKKEGKFIEIFIKGIDPDESWACYDSDDDEIRINGSTGINFDFKKITFESDCSYSNCVVIKSIEEFKRYFKMVLSVGVLFEYVNKQIKYLQKLDNISEDFV